MKVKVAKLKTVALIAFAMWNISSFAQSETMMYVMKNGEIVFSLPVSDVDQVTFDGASPDSALVVNKNDGSLSDKILLNNIQQLSFSDVNLSVETSNGSKVYAFENIMKLVFDNMNATGINNPPVQNGFDVLAYVTPEGDAVVKSPLPIKSLTLFGIDGKIISQKHCNGIEMQCTASLQGKLAGVYLIRVETEQNTVVKKVVNPLNK